MYIGLISDLTKVSYLVKSVLYHFNIKNSNWFNNLLLTLVFDKKSDYLFIQIKLRLSIKTI